MLDGKDFGGRKKVWTERLAGIKQPEDGIEEGLEGEGRKQINMQVQHKHKPKILQTRAQDPEHSIIPQDYCSISPSYPPHALSVLPDLAISIPRSSS